MIMPLGLLRKWTTIPRNMRHSIYFNLMKWTFAARPWENGAVHDKELRGVSVMVQ